MARSPEPWYGRRMTDEAVTDFLNERATGVLALADGRRAYGIPVAFAYDEAAERAIFDLGFAPDSRKRSFLEATEEVCLTVYEHADSDDWRSVVMTGPLRELSAEEVDDDLEAWFHAVAGDIDVADGDLELQWYALEAQERSGRFLEPEGRSERSLE